ncbi:calcyclin binding protein [Plakobranchus ocellatus]|uniref:Calcyclin-binding protein n=1 Tax=Plakobranchus ocellatus TaxID=259542 RepID=A0AAV4DMY1_9GAST|nr:calcyclin binding protein [Plakobranchus ocellatus]
MSSLNELRLDLAEYEQLHRTAKRLKVQQSLSREIEKLRRDIATAEAKEEAKAAQSNGSFAVSSDGSRLYEENVTNYAWDQSDKFMKLYLTLDNLSSISEQDIQSEFANRSVTVKVKFQKKVCTLHIARLCEDISPKESYIKKKSDYVLVMMKKSDAGKTWPWVTEREKKNKEKDKPKVDDSDPSAGITSLLKNMYDEGDDEMKRTISKAFYESQMKQATGADPLADL